MNRYVQNFFFKKSEKKNLMEEKATWRLMAIFFLSMNFNLHFFRLCKYEQIRFKINENQ
jgi:hypothetical protein